jgi:hypothetical protein
MYVVDEFATGNSVCPKITEIDDVLRCDDSDG